MLVLLQLAVVVMVVVVGGEDIVAHSEQVSRTFEQGRHFLVIDAHGFSFWCDEYGSLFVRCT